MMHFDHFWIQTIISQETKIIMSRAEQNARRTEENIQLKEWVGVYFADNRRMRINKLWSGFRKKDAEKNQYLNKSLFWSQVECVEENGQHNVKQYFSSVLHLYLIVI